MCLHLHIIYSSNKFGNIHLRQVGPFIFIFKFIRSRIWYVQFPCKVSPVCKETHSRLLYWVECAWQKPIIADTHAQTIPDFQSRSPHRPFRTECVCMRARVCVRACAFEVAHSTLIHMSLWNFFHAVSNRIHSVPRKAYPHLCVCDKFHKRIGQIWKCWYFICVQNTTQMYTKHVHYSYLFIRSLCKCIYIELNVAQKWPQQKTAQRVCVCEVVQWRVYDVVDVLARLPFESVCWLCRWVQYIYGAPFALAVIEPSFPFVLVERFTVSSFQIRTHNDSAYAYGMAHSQVRIYRTGNCLLLRYTFIHLSIWLG